MFASLAMNVLNQPMIPFRVQIIDFHWKVWTIYQLNHAHNNTYCIKLENKFYPIGIKLFHRDDVVDA